MLNNFVKTVVKNKKVFYLEVDESFAMCGSKVFYIEETKEAIPVALFWENADKALACKADEWENGVLQSATLEEFIEMCIGMQVETMAIGIGLKPDLSGGEEYIPVEMAKALVDEIERTKTAVTFSNTFDSLEHLKEILQMMGDS
jgi:hypothetical protein